MAVTLGLDIGANSIGWALIEDGTRILDAGVRVFPAGVDKFDTKRECSKNETRRTARGMRRQIARRARRKRLLRDALIDAKLWPIDAAARDDLLRLNPYELRARGLDEPLPPQHFGRALIHLAQRRGFKSNRKSKADAKEASEVLAEMNELDARREQAGCRTIGEYFFRHFPHAGEHERHDDLALERVRNWHTRRSMYEKEFEELWQSQSSRDGETARLLNRDPELKQRVHHLIFFQRELYWPKSMIGRCELEPRQPRCPRADRLAQRFRLLQEVNNLQYLDEDTGEIRPLAPEQRALLLEKLERRRDMSFRDIRTTLGLHESVQFNLERGERGKLKGMVTDAELANKHIFGKQYWELGDATKDAIVRAVLEEADESKLIERAMTEWGLEEAAAKRLAAVDLPGGYLHLSRTALEKLVPHMERGLLYMSGDDSPSALSEAGYLRPDQIQRRIQLDLPDPPDLPNPVVRQALYEVRKMVNTILREYRRKFRDPDWRPDHIHVELARNAKASAEERQKMSKRRAKRELERDDAAEEIRTYARERDPMIRVTRSRIDKLLLWKEQKGDCPYCDRSISMSQLFSGDADVDHILPYSRTLDDSFENRVVGHVRCNRDKGNRMPYEWLGERHPQRYDQMLQRVRALQWGKRKRFIQKELDLDKAITRHLNDTRYISRAVVEYVRCLMEQPHHVLCPKGSHTATLRRMWGLDSILSESGDSPAWAFNAELNPGEKNRADHRHHALDAIVLALTDHVRLQELARRVQDDDPLPEPWHGFRDHARHAVEVMRVSHRVRRRVSGALHEDTHYGPTDTAGEYVVRKPLEALTPSMAMDIRDTAIRELVLARLAQHGVECGRGTEGSIPVEVWREPLCMKKSGVPVRKVRLIRREKTIRPIRSGTAFVKPGSTHHVSLFKLSGNGQDEFDAVFTTTLDAIERIKRRQPIITARHPDDPNAEFLFSLSQSEMLLLEIDGHDRLFRFDTAASTSKQMWFLPHTSADVHGRVSKKPNTLMKANPRKVTIDPLGRVRWAND